MCIDQTTEDGRQKADFCVPLRGTRNTAARRSRDNHLSPENGISLIELIMFIVIVSVALAGILTVMNTVTRGGADPLIRKQALAIAESLLEEVELMPFTYCDPDDANAVTAANILACTTPEVIGTEGGETRYSSTIPFDNVSDYDGCGINAPANPGCDAAGNSGIRDISNTPVSTALNGYTAQITVVPTVIPAVVAASAIDAAESLLVTVTVTGPDNEPVVLQGYRTRYSPRSVP